MRVELKKIVAGYKHHSVVVGNEWSVVVHGQGADLYARAMGNVAVFTWWFPNMMPLKEHDSVWIAEEMEDGRSTDYSSSCVYNVSYI